MADFNETQSTERRITDTKTRRDHTAPVSGSSLTVSGGERHDRTEQGDIATYDGTIKPANHADLAFLQGVQQRTIQR